MTAVSDTKIPLVLASNNAGKLKEIQAVLDDFPCHLQPQKGFFDSEAEETGLTFVENAILKARHAAQLTGLGAIADDSGLEVDCLQGEPGVFSARYAGPSATDADNNQKLVDAIDAALQGDWSQVPTARFHCVIVYLRNAQDPIPLICQGCWEGHIVRSPQGQHGFGYDPHFYVNEFSCTAAELPATTKNSVSHRGQALAQLRQHFRL